MMQSALIIFTAACTFGMVSTWFTRRIAAWVGLVDRPDGHRKLQASAVPLGGGIAVFATTVLIFSVLGFLDHPWWSLMLGDSREMLGLFAGAAIIVFVGVLDDFHGLRGRQKLLGQITAATVVTSCGMLITKVQLFDSMIDLGWMAYPFTLFWLLGAINALNLLDGIDGLAGSIGVIITLAVSAMAAVGSHPEVAVVGAVFAGSLIGCLRYNLPPATIYLGDAGSMLIGLVVGTLSIQATLKGPGTVLLAAPLAVLAIPIFDSVAAILRRKLSGRSIYATDRGHLHHLLTHRLGNRKALLVISLGCTFTAVGALLSVYWRNDFVALISAAGLTAVFVATRIFGHSELLLVASSMRQFGRSFLAINRSPDAVPWESHVHLQGNRQWLLLWNTLTEWAEKLSLTSIRLNVSVPTIHEGYHATWTGRQAIDPDSCWKIRLPLVIGGRMLGHLDIIGQRDERPAAENLAGLLDLLEPFESRLMELTSPIPAEIAAGPQPAMIDTPQRPRPHRHGFRTTVSASVE